MKTAENYDRLLTLSDTSKILHVCPNALRNWDKNDTLKAVNAYAASVSSMLIDLFSMRRNEVNRI